MIMTVSRRRIMSYRSLRPILILGLALSFLAPAVLGQPPVPAFKDTTDLPEGPAGARIRSLIEVMNSGSVDRIKRFINEECAGDFQDRIPLEDHVSTALGFLRDTGGIDFHSVRTYTPERPGATVVIVKDRILGGWWGLSFRFGEAPKFLVNGLGINAARPPAGIAEPPLTEKEAVVEIRALLAKVKEKDWYSGTVLVAKGSNILLTDFAGEASKAFHVPNNIDTKFNLGSMNKMFTVRRRSPGWSRPGSSRSTTPSANGSTRPGCPRTSRARSRSATSSPTPPAWAATSTRPT
ncbi:MAG: hypothetical protein MZV64_12945 [Ignavibacteriales bacterium]|nr:hypothetical protein [Ignavibacteriales bacterium]